MKKLFIYPTAQLIKLETSHMICGSGKETTTIPFGGGSGNEPTPTNNIISGDAKYAGNFNWN